jgi:hypothetical protein
MGKMQRHSRFQVRKALPAPNLMGLGKAPPAEGSECYVPV